MINEHDITKSILNKIRSYKLIKEADELDQNQEQDTTGEKVNVTVNNIVFSGKLKDIDVSFVMNYDKQLGLIVNAVNLKLDDTNKTTQELIKLNVYYKQWIDLWVQRLEENNQIGDDEIIILRNGILNNRLDDFIKGYWDEDKNNIRKIVTNTIEFDDYIINPK